MTGKQRKDCWLRFRLGLPPRAVDLVELERIAPELTSVLLDSKLDSSREWPRFRAHEHEHHRRDMFLAWILSASKEEIERYRKSDRQRCKYPECFLTEPSREEERQRPEESSPDSGDSREPFFPQLMVLGGIKKPLARFLDCVRRVHARKKPIKKIVLTDPYIFISESEHGTSGGFDNFLQYVAVLELAPGTLEILLPPDAKGRESEAATLWHRSVSNTLKKQNVTLSVTRFKAGHHFHDRFYLSQHLDGKLSGLFGPSLNGLSDTDFVLLGELEDNVLGQLKSYLQL